MLPKTSRIWMYRFPFGYAARATRTVSWGTGQIACGFSDIDPLLWAILHLLFLPFLASLFLYRQGLRDSPAVSSENSGKKSKKRPPTPLPDGDSHTCRMVINRSILRDWLLGQGHLIAQALQTPDQLLFDFAMILSLEKGFPFFLILLARVHHLIINHENTMTYCQCCSFTPSPFFEPTIPLPQVSTRATNAMGCLD